jgi:chromate reductase
VAYFSNNTPIASVVVAGARWRLPVGSSLKIVSIAGSLRSASYSRIVLTSIEDFLPTGTGFDTIDIDKLRHLQRRHGTGRIAPFVVYARTCVDAADAIVIVTPEFNHGPPGVLKNTLGWLSRPASSSCMLGKPVFFVTLSPGGLGGVRAQCK